MARIYHSSLPPLPIPICSVPTYIFTAGSPHSRQKPQYFDAENPARNLSLAQAETFVRRIGLGLQKLGLKSDDKVLLYAGNSIFFPVLLWGVLAGGFVFTGCSPGASVTELSYQLKDSDARLLLCGVGSASNAMEAAKQAGLSRDRVFEFCDPDAKSVLELKLAPWTDFWASEGEARVWRWKEFSNQEEAMVTTAVINYSSGTTGLPKGVELSHYNLVANSEQGSYKRNMVADTPEGKARRKRLDVSGERWLAPLPMFHAYGQTYFCMNAPRCGVKVFVMPRYDITKYLTFLDIYRITLLTGVPTLMVSLSKHPAADLFNLHAVEQVLTGSAPLDPKVGSMVQERLLRPGVRVKQGWGMTECVSAGTGFAPDDDDDGSSIGNLNSNMSAKIVPMAGHDFGAGSGITYLVGEIWLAGPNIMKGYYRKPEETANTITYEDEQRWLKTGDIGYIDDRTGKVYIIDRMKELIKVKGFQVAPAELEGTLLQHPGVLDAAVVGFKTKDGEYPKAYVVKKQESLTAEDLQRFIGERLSKYKWLTGGVDFIDLIPRTASGKVIRRALSQSKVAPTGGNSKL